MDGTIIRGQNEISHPTKGSMELINKSNSSVPALHSRIKRVFYMSSEGNNLLHEVFPTANPAVLEHLRSVDCIIFAMGSLFTPICPSLVLLGVGQLISSRNCPKVLFLNGTHDRETSGFKASCFVTAITDALNRSYGHPHNSLKNPVSIMRHRMFASNHYLRRERIEKSFSSIIAGMDGKCLLLAFSLTNKYINTIFVPRGGQIPIDVDCLAAQGIFHVVTVDSVHDPKGGILFDPKSLIQALANLFTGCKGKSLAGV